MKKINVQPKDKKTPDYVSKERTKEVERVFRTLGLLPDQASLRQLPYSSRDYHMPFEQFSILKDEKTISTTSNTI